MLPSQPAENFELIRKGDNMKPRVPQILQILSNNPLVRQNLAGVEFVVYQWSEPTNLRKNAAPIRLAARGPSID